MSPHLISSGAEIVVGMEIDGVVSVCTMSICKMYEMIMEISIG